MFFFCNKLIIIYNFDKNEIKIEDEKEIFEKYFKEFDFIESGQLLTDQNQEYLTYNQWIEFKNNFEFFLKQQRSSAHCNCIPSIDFRNCRYIFQKMAHNDNKVFNDDDKKPF